MNHISLCLLIIALMLVAESSAQDRDVPIKPTLKVHLKPTGKKKTESSTEPALNWLAAHQLPDGSWSFDHNLAEGCDGKCTHHGNLKTAKNAATAMALLPFLAAGHTPLEGKYKKNIDKGIHYLLKSGKQKGNRMSFVEQGGTMYSHGLCTIVLCETYALTKGASLKKPAQASLNFIIYAQDPVGGGWRYTPLQPGDTSVLGWQLTALQSGRAAGLNVPRDTLTGASKFLDSVQLDKGAAYGYTTPGSGAATSSIGLLSRLYLGWNRVNNAVKKGVKETEKKGISKSNLYYNYFSTQLLWHYGGEPWKKWNRKLQEYLVASQEKKGHAKRKLVFRERSWIP